MEALLAILSYLLGSIPTGFIVGNLAGLDIRTAGSGNIGATNVARVIGKKSGLLTLIADAAKGFIPVLIAQQAALSDATVAVIGAAAFLGHLFPIFLKFKGGKGVATALGVLLALAPIAALVLLVVFGVAFFASRIVSLSSIIAGIAAPMVLWLFSYPRIPVVLSGFIGAMIVFRHVANIQRLLNGTEPRFGRH